MCPLWLLAETQYFIGIQLPSLQSPTGWEIVWRKWSRAVPLGGQGDPRPEGGSLWKLESGRAKDKFQRMDITEGRKGISLGWANRSWEVWVPKGSLRRWLAMDSLKALSLKKTSGLSYCLDKQSDAWGTGFASLFLLSWLHITGVLSGYRGVLGYARRGREQVFARRWKLCSLPSSSFLGNAEAGRGAGWGFLLASQSIFSWCLLFIPLAKPSSHSCHSRQWEFSWSLSSRGWQAAWSLLAAHSQPCERRNIHKERWSLNFIRRNLDTTD